MNKQIKVIKREGYSEAFNPYAIITAINKAVTETGTVIEQHGIIKAIAEHIMKTAGEEITVNEIQDRVVQELNHVGLNKVADAYAEFRNKRDEERAKGLVLGELPEAIWNGKYRHDNETMDEWLDRVSGGNARIRKLIAQRKFLFAGRILAHRGIDANVTYSNCYVMQPPADSIEAIFETAKELARTYSYGGGCGVDITNLRPKGAPVNNSAKETSGAVSFMQLYDLTTALIGQHGRRGALMISIADTHPDLVDFIDIKAKDGSITKANISIRVSDDFMQAVVDDKDWRLHFTCEDGTVIEKVVNAREVFRKNSVNNWDWAEAGNLFWSRITGWHLMSEHPEHEFAGVNPCAEEPLMAGGSCLLGSLNLSEFVLFPYTDKARFDLHKFSRAVHDAVIGLNEVLDEGVKLHPLQIQSDNARDWRQIGLGVMGIADMLIKMGIKYGDDKALELNEVIAKEMANSAIYASAMLAKEHGTFPMYYQKAVFDSPYFQAVALPHVKEAVRKYGLRNSQILTIAPTGSLSSMLNISGGIEPMFAKTFTRKSESLGKDGQPVYFEVETPIVREVMDNLGIDSMKDLPDFVVTAHDLHWRDRVNMQSVWQHYIDASISSTVNMAKETTVEEVEEMFIYAWQKGLKGITIFRDGCKRAGILTVNSDEEETVEEPVVEIVKPVEMNGYNGDIKYQACPECGEPIAVVSGGCSICLKCGYSPCN
jgi:ribonucleoside-diphosphate reductase alpha chain